jgi:glycosyltransferase involved in cell wall biosynthesis
VDLARDNAKMNIGTVIPWFPSPSLADSFLGNFQHSQSKKLVEMGHNVVVIAVRRPGMPQFENIDGISVYRLPACTLPGIRYDIPNFVSLTGLISDICLRHELALVEFFSSDFLTSIPAIYIKRKIDRPVVVVVNGLPGISWFSGNRLIDVISRAYTRLIGLRIIKSADGVRLLQDALHDELSGFGVDRNRMKTIHQGVDTGIFYPRRDNSVRAELGLNKEDFLVLYVGRLVKPVEMKGTGYLIGAVRGLLPEYPNLKLVFVGDGDGRVKNEEQAEPIKSCVRFTGYRNDVYRFMSAADVLVLPSLSEGCPVVVLEAGACGIPVIATRVGAVPELIEDGKTGIIVRPRSPEEIKRALVQLLENPSLRQSMGERARIRIKEKFTWEATCRKLEGLYQEVIHNYPGKKKG